MKKLIVLDFTTGRVHIYNYDREGDVDNDYIASLGYPANDCQYMVGRLEIIYHKGILT